MELSNLPTPSEILRMTMTENLIREVQKRKRTGKPANFMEPVVPENLPEIDDVLEKNASEENVPEEEVESDTCDPEKCKDTCCCKPDSECKCNKHPVMSKDLKETAEQKVGEGEEKSSTFFERAKETIKKPFESMRQEEKETVGHEHPGESIKEKLDDNVKKPLEGMTPGGEDKSIMEGMKDKTEEPMEKIKDTAENPPVPDELKRVSEMGEEKKGELEKPMQEASTHA
ncbi:unnamed protein product [Notodromas monacha]|uniref:Uncharacterized protein n=1 Tax=Notodromas monacha TaxID=399045 RepID=A0A7R9GD64_9CRUS|nr:unnamed protein product [Notodromas monacha]CAG0918219.1 unnamed protein product [Notodromas monacha]